MITTTLIAFKESPHVVDSHTYRMNRKNKMLWGESAAHGDFMWKKTNM